MFIRYNQLAKWWEYDGSNGAGAGPWIKLEIDYSQIINAPPPGITPHHITHETGGSDAIATLDASVIKTGSIADSKLSSNVALKNINNAFNQTQSIAGGLVLTGAGGAGGVYERNRPNAMGDWIAFTPSWITTGNPASIGNGTLVGRYTLIGRTVYFKIGLNFGSTTVIGTGQYFFALPFVATGMSVVNLGGAFCVSGGGSTIRADAQIYTSDLSNCSLMFSGGILSNAYPFAWVNTDYIRLSGFYETT
jgi:hypothetical protein